MRRMHLVVFFGYLALCWSNTPAQEPTPARGKVVSSAAIVRSGPSETDYGVLRLARGSVVDIFRQEANGWLAIRPPKLSYSLVNKDDLKPTNDPAVAEVVRSSAPSRIGSPLKQADDMVTSVQLNRGEMVSLLSSRRKRFRNKEDARSYVAIAPPAGEFRWIHRDNITIVAADNALGKSGPTPDRTLGRSAELDLAKAARRQASEGAPFASPETPSNGSGWTRRTGASAVSDREQRSEKVPLRLTANRQSLEEVNIELAKMVTNQVETWDLRGLRQRAEELVDTGQDAFERGRARLVLDRIQQFESLQNRQPLESSGNRDGALSAEGAAPSAGNGDDARVSSTRDDLSTAYDGKGWLMPVQSLKQPAPPFALLDADGRILKFVSPAPGLNLRRYIKKEIGVIGKRGYVDSLDMAHVTADRIVELDRHRR